MAASRSNTPPAPPRTPKPHPEAATSPVLENVPRPRRPVMKLVWTGVYFAIVVTPLALMLVRAPGPRGFWVELSLALGFLGLAQLAVQFALIARFRRVTAPYGIDTILYYHRQLGTVAIAFILLHPVILLVRDPALLRLLSPVHGTWASRAGTAALGALILLALLSFLRRQLRLGYEAWRLSHAALAIVAITCATAHVALTGPYTDTAWKLAVWIVLAAFGACAIGYARILKPLRERRLPYRVADVSEEAERVWTLAVRPDGHAGLRFQPGQFAWIKLRHPFNVDEHPFSFSSSAEEPGTLRFGIKQVGDFTGKVPEIPEGTTVYLDGPHGAFSIDRIPAPGYVLIAGGVGVVPFVSMLRTMHDRADHRPVRLIYGARDEDDLPYRDELDSLSETPGWPLDIVYVLKNPPEDWTGKRGMISRDLIEACMPGEDPPRDYLICGPTAMIVSVEKSLRSLGVHRLRVHAERFDLV